MRIIEYESKECIREKHIQDLQNKMNDLLEDNDDLKQKVKDFDTDTKTF